MMLVLSHFGAMVLSLLASIVLYHCQSIVWAGVRPITVGGCYLATPLDMVRPFHC